MMHKTSRTERSLKAMDVSPGKCYWWRHFIPWKIGNWLQKKVNVKGFKEKLMDLWIDKRIYKKEKYLKKFFFLLSFLILWAYWDSAISRQTVKSCWDDHHINQTGLIIRAKMPPPPEPRFTLTTGWGCTRRELLIFYGQSLTAEF